MNAPNPTEFESLVRKQLRRGNRVHAAIVQEVRFNRLVTYFLACAFVVCFVVGLYVGSELQVAVAGIEATSKSNSERIAEAYTLLDSIYDRVERNTPLLERLFK